MPFTFASVKPTAPPTTSAELFSAISGIRVLVIGDLMLDRYVWGRVNRISPEAPVPVLDVTTDEARLGGAANVALNLAALGAHVLLCGTIGDDASGEHFRSVMAEQGLSDAGLVTVSGRPTTTKTRIIGGSQHLLRVDRETTANLSAEAADALRQRIHELMHESGAEPFHAIVFEDYDKGLLSPPLIQDVIAHSQGIPVLVDPKHRNFFAYAGCTVFKPNLKELGEGLGRPLNRLDSASLQSAVHALRQRMPHALTLLTLSEQGVLLCDATGEFHHLPAHVRSIVDVSGAGDTVVSVMAACVATGLDPLRAAALANLAGGLVCEAVGVVPIDAAQLAEEARQHGVLS